MPLDPTDEAANAAAQQPALEALYAWYRDWSATARAVIKRRDLLIIMGLAKRHTNKNDTPVTDGGSPAPTNAAPVTPGPTTATPPTPESSNGKAA